jgi:hypothetical protein
MENDLSVFPSLDELKEKEKALRKEIEQLEEERKLALTDTRIHAYNDGHARGEIARNIMSEEEFEQWRNSHLTVTNLALRAKSTISDRAIPRTKSSGMRPHQAIRKAITDRFDEENKG